MKNNCLCQSCFLKIKTNIVNKYCKDKNSAPTMFMFYPYYYNLF